MPIYDQCGKDSSRSLRLRLPFSLISPEIVAGLLPSVSDKASGAPGLAATTKESDCSGKIFGRSGSRFASDVQLSPSSDRGGIIDREGERHCASQSGGAAHLSELRLEVVTMNLMNGKPECKSVVCLKLFKSSMSLGLSVAGGPSASQPGPVQQKRQSCLHGRLQPRQQASQGQDLWAGN